MKSANNSISKRTVYNNYKMPASSKSEIIVPCCSSGYGFETRYDTKWTDVVDHRSFQMHVGAVGSAHQANKICYQVYDEIRREEAGASTNSINQVMSFAVVIVLIACGIAVFVSFIGDSFDIKNIQYMLYAAMILTAIASVTMFSVITYSLRNDYQFIEEHHEIGSRISQYFARINGMSSTLFYRLSDDHCYISINKK